jgi:hypothetical protein
MPKQKESRQPRQQFASSSGYLVGVDDHGDDNQSRQCGEAANHGSEAGKTVQ